MKALASRIVGQIGDETEVVTEIPNLTLHRFDEPTKPTGYLLEPSVCMILQGLSAWSLATMITSTMRPAFFVTSIDLPLIAQILEASPSDPYVGMTLKLDRMQIAQLILNSQLPSLNSGKASRAIELGALSKPLIRRHRTIDRSAGRTGVHPGAFTVGPEGDCFPAAHDGVWAKIRQIATGGSHIHQISRVIDWIKGNLSERLRVEDLASRAGMSGFDLAPPLPVVDCVESAAV